MKLKLAACIGLGILLNCSLAFSGDPLIPRAYQTEVSSSDQDSPEGEVMDLDAATCCSRQGIYSAGAKVSKAGDRALFCGATACKAPYTVTRGALCNSEASSLYDQGRYGEARQKEQADSCAGTSAIICSPVLFAGGTIGLVAGGIVKGVGQVLKFMGKD